MKKNRCISTKQNKTKRNPKEQKETLIRNKKKKER
jgi:hypothetical protein